MRIPDSVLREVADKTDMLDVVGRYLRLDKKGGRYWGLCPFHTEKTPSFSVNPEKQLFYCFGCHAKGTLYTFVQEIERMTFVEAVRFLAERAGVPIPTDNRDPDEDRRRAALMELNSRVSGSWAHILWNTERGRKVRDYLARRGVPEETARRFGLGYAPQNRVWLFGFLTQKSYSEEFLSLSGLFLSRREPDGTLTAFFRDRLVFPIRALRGDVVGFGGRAFDPEAPKYLNTPETPYFRKGEHLYGLHEAVDAIKRQDTFVLVEGYMDVIAMHQAGIGTAVAPLGTSLTERQAKMLARYAHHGVICFDTDEAGQRATARAAEMLEAAGLECRVMTVPGAKDPAELVERGEAGELPKALEAATPAFSHLLSRALAGRQRLTSGAKVEVVAALGEFLSKASSPVRRQDYVSMLAETLDIGVDSVNEELIKRTRPGRAPAVATPGGPVPAKAIALSDELRFLLSVAANREYFADVRNSIGLDDLGDDAARAVFVALEECFRNGETSMDSLIQRLGDDQLARLTIAATESGEYATNAPDVIGDGIRAMRVKGLRRRGRAIDTRLRVLGGENSTELKELLEEKMFVDHQLQEMKVAGDA